MRWASVVLPTVKGANMRVPLKETGATSVVNGMMLFAGGFVCWVFVMVPGGQLVMFYRQRGPRAIKGRSPSSRRG